MAAQAASAQIAAGQGQIVQQSNGLTPTQQLAQLVNETTNTLSQLFGNLMILKAACINVPSYIDRLLTPFMHMLQKLVKEHLVLSRIHAGSELNSTLCVELICLSLELVKNRIGVMSMDMKRAFIQNVFVILIEKSPDTKVMKAILKILEEWIKQPSLAQQGRSATGVVHSLLLRERVCRITR